MILDFHPLKEARLEELHRYFALRPNYSCDSTLFDTVLWDGYFRTLFAAEGDVLYLKPGHPKHPVGALPVCRAEDLPGAVLRLQAHFHEDLKRPLKIPYMDEDACRLLQEALPQFRYTESPELADYLYDGDALRSLAGKKYHKKKNHVNSFRKRYEGRFEYCALSEVDYGEMTAFLQRWEAQRLAAWEEKEATEADVSKASDPETDGASLEQEKSALREEAESLHHELAGLGPALKRLGALNARAAGVRVDGQLEALTVGTYNPVTDMAIIHVEKANPEIDGLYSFINQEFLLHAFPTARLVNREDDMGLAALRQAKLSYHPVRFLTKWTLEELP